jgi:hypothetical protein
VGSAPHFCVVALAVTATAPKVPARLWFVNTKNATVARSLVADLVAGRDRRRDGVGVGRSDACSATTKYTDRCTTEIRRRTDPRNRAFVGALQGTQTSRGVFVTTGARRGVAGLHPA